MSGRFTDLLKCLMGVACGLRFMLNRRSMYAIPSGKCSDIKKQKKLWALMRLIAFSSTGAPFKPENEHHR